jgi:hypothetical protein
MDGICDDVRHGGRKPEHPWMEYATAWSSRLWPIPGHGAILNLH